MVIRQGLRSTSLAVAFAIIAIVMALFVLNAVQETSSRLAWSFARDNGLLFSSTLAQIHPKLQVPVYALLVTYGILVVCGCVFLASTTGTYESVFLRLCHHVFFGLHFSSRPVPKHCTDPSSISDLAANWYEISR